MTRCDVCKKDKEWHERYNLAIERFDRSLQIAMTVTIVAVCAALASIVLMAMCVAKTLRFISDFECVEETVVEQDGEGQNIAVLIDGSRTETKGGK